MSGKEQFQKIKRETPYISKDGKFYAIKFYDEKNDCCHYRVTDSYKGRNEKDIPTYEDACKFHNIELEETIPTPDQYFLKKVDEESNTNILRTVSDSFLISYLSEHKGDCPEAIEKLKEIVQTHDDIKVRKAACSTLKKLEIEGYKDLESYIKEDKDKGKRNKITYHLSSIAEEKAVIVYMALVKRYKDNRDAIKFGIFSNQWDVLFSCDKYGKTRDMKINAFKYVKDTFDNESLEEIQKYRDTLSIYDGYDVPNEIKQLAHEKGVIIALAENRNKHLSGFDILIRQGKNQTFRFPNVIPFGLNENAVKNLLLGLPTKKELQEKEKALMDTLRSETLKVKQKKAAVNSYKAPYATHEFKKFMNRFTIYNCTNQQLTLFCVNLCNRVGINNLSNEMPIEYKFCVGSGKRKQTMKRINNRKRGNKKAAKKRKGR